MEPGELPILDVFYCGGFILKEDISGYCRLVRESTLENIKNKSQNEVLWDNSTESFVPGKADLPNFNKADNALKKFRNSIFPSQIYMKDILDLDIGFAQHGEVFMMCWQLAENFKKWENFDGRSLVKNLILIDRWVSANCFDERESWLSEIKNFNKEN